MGKIKHLIVRGGLGIGLFLTSGLGIWAQISLNEENKSVREVIKSIEKVSDYRFFYNEDLAGLNTRITVSADDASIETILAMISKQAPIAYTIKNNHQIVLSDGKNGKLTSTIKLVTNQQGKTITGTVLDHTNVPIIGANIVVKGTTNGTITDIDGHFSLEVNKGTVLQVSYIGYQTQEITVGDKNHLSIILKEDVEALDELVVTALGIKREEKALGYSVQKMDGDDMPAAKSVDITSSLTGKIAGLNIQNNTEFD